MTIGELKHALGLIPAQFDNHKVKIAARDGQEHDPTRVALKQYEFRDYINTPCVGGAETMTKVVIS